jgi:hypothetical protein
MSLLLARFTASALIALIAVLSGACADCAPLSGPRVPHHGAIVRRPDAAAPLATVRAARMPFVLEASFSPVDPAVHARDRQFRSARESIAGQRIGHQRGAPPQAVVLRI